MIVVQRSKRRLTRLCLLRKCYGTCTLRHHREFTSIEFHVRYRMKGAMDHVQDNSTITLSSQSTQGEGLVKLEEAIGGGETWIDQSATWHDVDS